jgi:hypothetical protein
MRVALTLQVASIMPLTCCWGISTFLVVSRLITSSCALNVPRYAEQQFRDVVRIFGRHERDLR